MAEPHAAFHPVWQTRRDTFQQGKNVTLSGCYYHYRQKAGASRLGNGRKEGGTAGGFYSLALLAQYVCSLHLLQDSPGIDAR